MSIGNNYHNITLDRRNDELLPASKNIADVKHRRVTKPAINENVMDTPTHFIEFEKPNVLAKVRFRSRMLREAIKMK